jgi:hypothetical protein
MAGKGSDFLLCHLGGALGYQRDFVLLSQVFEQIKGTNLGAP